VKVNTPTLQRLMLNLAFVNMLSSRAESVVRKSALDLLYTVFATFDVAHTKHIARVPVEILPDDLLDFVTSLSADIAESWDGFLSEFMKVYRWIERQTLSIKCFRDMPTDGNTLMTNVWAEPMHDQRALWELNRRILDAKDTLAIVTGIAGLDPKPVGKFWTGEFAVAKKRENVVSCACVLAQILATHAFDVRRWIPNLIAALVSLRPACGQTSSTVRACAAASLLQATACFRRFCRSH
jgi:hypothetical protein